MKLTDLSNSAIKAFLGCSTVHASRIRTGARNVPKSKRRAFSERFNIPMDQLSNQKGVTCK